MTCIKPSKRSSSSRLFQPVFSVTSIPACHLAVDSCENCFNCWKSLSESEQLLGQLYCSSALGYYAISSNTVIITIPITGVPQKLVLLLNPHRLCCSYILRGLLWSGLLLIFACRCLLIPLQTSLRITPTIVSPLAPHHRSSFNIYMIQPHFITTTPFSNMYSLSSVHDLAIRYT